MHIAIIGAGAAGCFAAINLKRLDASVRITVFESGAKPLAKVAVTGGGRCNLTNSFEDVKSMASVYPRGERLMKRLLREFSHEDVYRWFEKEGVKLVTQDDQCVFPKSQDAMEIVDTLTRLMREYGVVVKTGHRVSMIEKTDHDEGTDERFRLFFNDNSASPQCADIVVVTTGGSSKQSGLGMLDGFGLDIAEPVPSLFSLCLPKHNITELMGTVVDDVTVGITGTKHKARGALLVTHWGVSGPAILKLSSYAARTLKECNYKAQLSINWFGSMNETEVMERIMEISIKNRQKRLATVSPEKINNRLWIHLLQQSGINPQQRWGELARKSYNRLVNTMTNDLYAIDGKNRFKDEFVTCGGVALSNHHPSTLECNTCKGLYFAGEVLDVDAITGGFNLQAAWTMGYVVAKAIVEKGKRNT